MYSKPERDHYISFLDMSAFRDVKYVKLDMNAN